MHYVLILSMMLWTAGALAAEQNQSVYKVQQDLQRARAQLTEARQFASKESPIDRNLFPPELVMRHRVEIELTDIQRSELTQLKATSSVKALSNERILLTLANDLTSVPFWGLVTKS